MHNQPPLHLHLTSKIGDVLLCRPEAPSPLVETTDEDTVPLYSPFLILFLGHCRCSSPAEVSGVNMKKVVSSGYRFPCVATYGDMDGDDYYGAVIVVTIFIGSVLLLSATVLFSYVLYQKTLVRIVVFRAGYSRYK